ncbi:helix-turn-helix transcriptional regulator [Salinispora tropica]|uniref:Transcriptional regulator, AraC family n=1 Tax=Salinispora tropica (strain ATCC BAA-916 / DSM 44818 / JCM 13857 / NBRC 105044 / CNB-440) TaxID=369723 RepID=A4X2I0_SALTO|nr:AraC family transcriptional regulator [Salinispora tropica]ABP53080.1 transcriptional regulator, AraC family [Salinispora tropica CNB-440]
MTTADQLWRQRGNCLECAEVTRCSTLGMCLDNPTDAARLDSVTRAVEYMTAHFSEPQRLSDIAQAALLSPFHFHRVFRHVTSTTPARFLTALRMARARSMLVNSNLSVTEVCLGVGYSSLGTFISQFTKLTGMSPRRFRAAMSVFGHIRLSELTDPSAERHFAPGPVGAVTGGPSAGGCAVLALYRSEEPDDVPVTYGVLETNRLSHFRPLADGAYHAVALGFDNRSTLSDVLGDNGQQAQFVGTGDVPIVVRGGRTRRSFQIALRCPRPIDPPVQLTSALLALAQRRQPRLLATGS